MQDVEKPVSPEWLTRLKHGRVFPFTRSQDFIPDLHEVFDLIQEQVLSDRSRYSQDWVSVGLPGLANGCIRKASRVYDLFVMDMPGKDKPEDELRDNMMLGIYTYLYYKMMTEGPRSGREGYPLQAEIPSHSSYSKEVSVESQDSESKVSKEALEGTVDLEDNQTEESSKDLEELEVRLQGSNFLGQNIQDTDSSEEEEETEQEGQEEQGEGNGRELPEEKPGKPLSFI